MDNFRLSGFGDTELEEFVLESIKKAKYTEAEMLDFREPAQYRMYSYVVTADELVNSLSNWSSSATLFIDFDIPKENILKAMIKKLINKLIRWYIIPIVDAQTRFNNETILVVSQLMAHIQVRERVIDNMYEQIKELEG